MNTMENFFNWMTKQIPTDEVTVWFNIHNMNYEKIELYGDIFKSLNHIISDTYMGDDDGETKIILTQEDKATHFNWCWNKLIDNFKKELIIISLEGDHKNYFESFYDDTFYNQPDDKVKIEIPTFINEIFDMDKTFTKSDLEILTELYKLLEKNIEQ